MEDETGYLAVVKCVKATALRHEMRSRWLLPDEKQFRYTGPDWLVLLLSSADEASKAKILLLLWRAWYHTVVHDKGRSTIMGSAFFLTSYVESINGA
jgi:hypothetical protein